MKVLRIIVGSLAVSMPIVSGQSVIDLLGSYASVGAGKSYTLSNITGYLKADEGALAQINQGGSTFFAPIDSSIVPAIQNLKPSADYVHAALYYHTILNQLYNPAGNVSAYALLETALKAPISTQYVNLPSGGQKLVAVKGNPTKVRYGVKQANIVDTLVAANGVINVVDSFLLIPSNASTTAPNALGSQFDQYLVKANLTATVDGLSGVTIFVPQDNAFQAVAGTLDSYSTQQLQNLLQSHIIKSAVYSTSVVSGTALTTFGGTTVSMAGSSSGLTVTGNGVTANVVSGYSDMPIAGGVMHTIDTVLFVTPNNSNNQNATNPGPKSGDGDSRNTMSPSILLAAALLVVLAL
jgi:uncharacterized surface protein with fasciclin (FAS1) repeats